MACEKINSYIMAFGIWFIALMVGREILMPEGRVLEHTTSEVLVFWFVPLFMVIGTGLRLIAAVVRNLCSTNTKNPLSAESRG